MAVKITDELKKEIRKQAFLELARRDFWYYCKLFDSKRSPFYLEDRYFLKDLCYRLQRFVEEDDSKILVVNMPPRHGKSRTATLFVQWLLGKDQHYSIMTGCYNELLSTQFAKQVRDVIATELTDGIIVYNNVFPHTKIKYGEASMNKWALEGNTIPNYLATSPTGTATGFGAKLIIIDDLIKNAEEAFNANVLEKQISWFTNTMLSRLESGGKIIIIMTRWATGDLAGFILENYKGEVEHINYKAVNDDGTMLCDDVLSKEQYEFKIKNMDKAIVYANYQQEPIDIQGRLYKGFKTYTHLPDDKISRGIKSYCDTADTGEDYLCNIIYVDYKDSAYILDIIYTKEPMEVTEPLVAKALARFKVNIAVIESNNGGRSFARNVETKTKFEGNHTTVIRTFHQSANKQSRILSNSAWVCENIYFPSDWENKFPEFAKDIKTYQREGKNKHDDAPDALTGVAEQLNKTDIYSFEA